MNERESGEPIDKTNPIGEENSDDTESRFATPPKIAQDLIEKYSIEKTNDSVSTIEKIVEYEKAGRNLSGLCHQISRQEKKPILVINNARMGGLLQMGFKHWLANFESEEQANEFISELEDRKEYKEHMSELQQVISKFKDFLDSQVRPLLESIEDDSTKEGAISVLESLMGQDDPLSDIRIEIDKNRDAGRDDVTFDEVNFTYTPNYGYNYCGLSEMLLRDAKGVDYGDISAINLEILYDRQNPDATEKDRKDFLLTPTKLMGEAYKAKDHLRQLIFEQAEDWINENRIKSFAYSVNHFKIPTARLSTEIIEDILPNKFGETLQSPSSLLVFADVHSSRKRRGENQQLTVAITSEPPPTQEVINPADILGGELKYPFSEFSEGKSTSIRKEMLEKIGRRKPKVIDLQVIFPHQTPGLPLEDNSQATIQLHNRSDSESSMGEPAIIMVEEPLHKKYRDIILDLKNNPDWIYDFHSRIPIEPNYTFGGPEY